MQPDTAPARSVHSDSGRTIQFITPMFRTPMTPANIAPADVASVGENHARGGLEGELDMVHYKPFTLPSRAATSSAGEHSLHGWPFYEGGLLSNAAHHLLIAEPCATSPAHPFYPLLAPTPLDITMPAQETAPAKRVRLFEPGLLMVGTVLILLLYLVTPVVTTLLPIFPVMWSRLLMSLELLTLAQWLVVRVLLRTTKR